MGRRKPEAGLEFGVWSLEFEGRLSTLNFSRREKPRGSPAEASPSRGSPSETHLAGRLCTTPRNESVCEAWPGDRSDSFRPLRPSLARARSEASSRSCLPLAPRVTPSGNREDTTGCSRGQTKTLLRFRARRTVFAGAREMKLRAHEPRATSHEPARGSDKGHGDRSSLIATAIRAPGRREEGIGRRATGDGRRATGDGRRATGDGRRATAPKGPPRGKAPSESRPKPAPSRGFPFETLLPKRSCPPPRSESVSEGRPGDHNDAYRSLRPSLAGARPDAASRSCLPSAPPGHPRW